MARRRSPARADVISTVKHPDVVAARRRLGRVGGKPATSFLVDGQRLVSQALESQVPVERVFLLDPVEEEQLALLGRARELGVACHAVTRGVFFRILGLGYETSVKVLAVVGRPQSGHPAFPDATELIEGDMCVLVGESIQDPRNVGVLIRTVDAWGLVCAVFSGDSGDPYSRASVRSSTGSAFRVPVTIAAHLVEYLERLKQRSVRLIGTSARAATPCWEADLSGPCAILFGNESVGLSAPAREVCDLLVSIPMTGGAHSFNVTVAAGIVLYERARQRSVRVVTSRA